ncbi:hypothetical protein [Actinomadura sp. NPDC048394]|uniref:hypothetical protein n=1 Tax=Actinomadura sp. NPDC048394 TaxID=3158223 RepID=UPI0033DB4D34
MVALGWDRIVRDTGETAKARKRKVDTEWIHPPVGDAAEILRRADYRVSTRPVASA